jgi:antirestriction protein ArdC
MNLQKDSPSVYKIINDRILAQLEKGVVPWQQSWTNAGIPKNLISGRPYRNINWILLSMLGYERNLFLTFKQVSDIGAKVRKGEKSHVVVFWKLPEKKTDEEDNEEKKKPLLRYYLVFNISQCENIPEKYIEPLPNPEPNINHRCAEIVQFIPDRPDIVHNMHKAFYDIKKDIINMPRIETFKDTNAYFFTLFHELIHSTGHENRLNRATLTTLSMENYSTEELTAEMGACYLMSFAGIPDYEIENSAAYINSWLKKLKDDIKFIFIASSQAQKAVDYILDLAESEPIPEASESVITQGILSSEELDDLPF